MYALIKDGIVANVIIADAAFVDDIAHLWDAVVAVQPDTCSVGWTYVNGIFTAPFVEPPPVAPPKPYVWYIDLGTFNDRFGAKKLAVLMSNDPVIKAFNSDKSDRHWIDLARADVRACVNYMAGVPLAGVGTMASPILTAEEAAAILDTPVTATEQLALVKTYF